jgi:hypothetical protein
MLCLVTNFCNRLVFVSSAILSMPRVGDLGHSRIHLKEKVGSILFLGIKNYNILNSKGSTHVKFVGIIKIGRVRRGSSREINKFKHGGGTL